MLKFLVAEFFCANLRKFAEIKLDFLRKMLLMGLVMYIYEQKDFPKFSYNKEKLFDVVAEVNALHSRLMGRMSVIGFDLKPCLAAI